MAAPKGNRFWEMRSKHGRDRLFATPEDMWEAACEYFEWCEENPFMEVEQKKGNMTIRVEEGGDASKFQGMDKVYLPKMRPFTMHGLCIYLGCNTTYFNNFEASIRERKDEVSKDFTQVITRIREVIYEQKFTGAASGFFNPNIIARDLGLSDKQEVSTKIKVTKKSRSKD